MTYSREVSSWRSDRWQDADEDRLKGRSSIFEVGMGPREVGKLEVYTPDLPSTSQPYLEHSTWFLLNSNRTTPPPRNSCPWWIPVSSKGINGIMQMSHARFGIYRQV